MRSRYWIQEAIKHPGSLKRWVKKNRARIKRATGIDPLTKDGRIKVTALKKLRRTKMYERLPAHRKRQINLAITLRELHK